MARRKKTIFLDERVLRATRIMAVRTEKRDSEVIEDALLEYLGLAVLDRVRDRCDLTAGQAESLAYEELHYSRN